MKCIDAFKNLYIEIVNGQTGVSPCCVTPTRPNTHNIDFENNQYLSKIRTSWSNNTWPTECGQCQKNEQQGIVSRRQGSNHWYEDNNLDNNNVELVRLDYWVGDLCNCACAICGPSFSSLWKQQLGFTTEIRKTVVNDFWKNLDLSNLKFVHFNGGEPLLSKEHVRFLKSLTNKHKIAVTYNTNGTVLPGDELQNLWSEFRWVELCFSIDDVESRFEYQRWPAKWQQITENLDWYRNHGNNNWMYAVNTTVSVLNQHNLPVLDNWLKENFAMTKCSDPIEHRKQLAWGKYAPGTDPELVRKSLDKLDQQRGTNWRETFPEFKV